MADVETPQVLEPRALPQVMVGAASPLWAYFGVAAAGGLAYWWMTRWARPVNLEAMFARSAPAAEPAIEAAETVAELPFEAVEAVVEAEAAVVEPEPVVEIPAELAAASDAPGDAVETAAEPVLQLVPEPEPVVEAAPPVEAAPQPVVEAVVEPVVEAAAEPVEAAEAAAPAYAWAEPEVALGFDAPAEEAAPAPPVAPKPKARKAAPKA